MAKKHTEPMKTQPTGGGPYTASPMATTPTKNFKAPRSAQFPMPRNRADAARRKSLNEQRSQLGGSQV
jgi:hypothetical protein